MKAALTALAAAAVVVGPAGASAAKPNLAERSVSNPPAKLVEGASLSVKDRASAKSKRAVVRYYLSADGKLSLEDVRLLGRRSMKRAAGKSRLRVPYTVPGAPLRLLACADDTGRVRERREGDNCVASKRTTTVSVAEKDRSVPRSANDAHRQPDQDAAFLSKVRFDQAECPAAPATGGRTPPLRAALRSTDRKLDAAAGPAAVAQFKASSAARNADAAEDAASRALIAGKPGAALKALLAAHRRKPKEPAYLVNAAALMASTGLPREALTLLASADDLEPRRAVPFGINTQAVALNAHGYALLELGRLDEAAALFRAALQIDPYFAEARSNLGAALQCKEAGRGVLFLRAGQFRVFDGDVLGGGDPPPPFVQPSPLDQFDLSAGKQAKLPEFKLPQTLEDAAGQRDHYSALQQDSLARDRQRGDRITELQPQFIQYNELSNRRYLDLLGAINDLSSSSEIKAVQQRLTARQVEIGQYGDSYFGDYGYPGSKWETWSKQANEECSNPGDGQECFQAHYVAHCRSQTEAAHSHWLSLMNAQLVDYAAWANLYYPTATGLAANISDPAREEVRSIQLEQDLDRAFNAYITAYAGFWSTYLRNSQCYDMGAPSTDAGSTQPDTPRAAPCPDFLKGVKFAWKIDKDSALGAPFDISLEVACEKVSVEISGKVVGKDNWIGAFGEFTYVPSTGKVTLFGGPKASAKIPGTSIGGSFKDGIYVSLSRDGTADAGFRVSPTVQGGLDQFSIKGSDAMEFSVAPVFGVER